MSALSTGGKLLYQDTVEESSGNLAAGAALETLAQLETVHDLLAGYSIHCVSALNNGPSSTDSALMRTQALINHQTDVRREINFDSPDST